jgi:hypothetical protein
VQEAFGTVIFVVAVGGLIVAILTLASSGDVYRSIGRGTMALHEDDELRDRPAPAPGSAAAAAEREDEIRQMLHARNARRERRGEVPLDVDAEMARLTAPAVEPGLRDEVRQLVIARNHRRVRQGKEPLDVEGEVERQLRELS